MSLDCSKLQMVRELGNGGLQARCPACAESGQDRKGEHLRVSADGKFGCCVYPGDREHRRRIFALVGQFGPKEIRVRVASAKAPETVQLDLLSRLSSSTGDFGTPGTPVLNPRAYANEDTVSICKLIEFEEPVPSVPTDGKNGMDGRRETARLPYLASDGTLVIPFDSPERYHWWKGGQSVKETIAEIRAREKEAASGAIF